MELVCFAVESKDTSKLSIITLFERNHITFELKQIIDEESNLLNKII